MIRSMTGFGRGEFSDGKRNVIAEIKTVNHRYADISIKMPKRYSFAEEKIKGIIKQHIFVRHGITFIDIPCHGIKLDSAVSCP